MAVSATLASSPSGFTYDVFLSFRGVDTRYAFASHLRKSLSDKGICTFFDDAELNSGDEITSSLVKAINESRIAVVVFSQNYAASRFCLDELVCILESSRANGQLILPVFYDVDPSDVRHQKGSYGEALAMHEKNFSSDMEKIKKWKRALLELSNLTGWHFEHGHRYEYEFIQDIVKDVCSKLDSAPLMAADHPVGLKHRVMDLEWLADDKSRDKYITIGIYGIGGVGKTTLARALYRSAALRFEASCFLDDVREISMKSGLVHLQEILLAETLGEKDLQLASVSEGTRLLKHRLHRKKVLLVLDDVDSLDQLQAVAGGTDWFGSGSLVITTTRDKHLLERHGVDRTYEVEGLTEDEALELLCWKAFKTDRVRPVYVDILYCAKAYASGIPLALEVIGSNLYGKGIEEWKSTLHSYEQIPNTDIQMILKLSYDALGEQEKQIFLDIACFFNGRELTEVERILSAHHGYCLTPRIRALVQKSLIKINERGCVTMHDLLQDLGREIVRRESPEHPGKRSRLWSTEDIIQVLEENAGTSEIQIIILDSPKSEGVVQWDGKAFMKMKDLRMLIIKNECFSEGPKFLPNSLRVLEWWGYPLQSLPSDFYPEKLAILKLPYGGFSPELSMFEKFLNMRHLNLDGCKCITHVPDVSGSPNLEVLSLVYCENIVEIHESVGSMNKLRIMDAEGCRRLRSFPPINLTSLQYLNLSHCSSLVSFPEILENMENITHLSLEYTAIRELPYSIGKLIQLQSLELHGCGMFQLPSSIVLLAELEWLSISQCEGLQSSRQDKGTEKLSSKVSSNVKHIDFLSCNISDEFIQIGLTWFANVKELDLSTNNFTILPACIQECHLLTKLNLNYCVNLEKIGGIPPNLETFSAVRCTSLKDLDLTVLLASNKEFFFLRELILDDCDNLQDIRGIPPSIELLSARNCRSLTASCRRMLLTQELHEAGNKRFCLPGSQMPEWFEHRSRGHSISFWFRKKFPAISLCLVGPMHKLPLKFRPIVIINGSITKTDFQTEKGFCFEFSSLTDHIYIFGERQIKLEDNVDEVPSENEWNHAVVSVDIDLNWNPMEPFVVRTGLHVIKQESSMDNIQFTNAYNQPFLKEMNVLGDMEVSRSLFVQLQKRTASLDL